MGPYEVFASSDFHGGTRTVVTERGAANQRTIDQYELADFVRASRFCFSAAGTKHGGGGGALNFEYVPLADDYYLYERDVGDINGDGKNDIVGFQEGDTTIQAFLAPDWKRSTLITIGGAFPYPRADDFKLADIDNDGDLDVVDPLGDRTRRRRPRHCGLVREPRPRRRSSYSTSSATARPT